MAFRWNGSNGPVAIAGRSKSYARSSIILIRQQRRYYMDDQMKEDDVN
jgi:hypothetical protein